MSDYRELPDAFTARQFRADPRLATLEPNPLFEAFRRYRDVYPDGHTAMRWWNRVRVPLGVLWLAGAAFVWMKWRNLAIVPTLGPFGFVPPALMMSGNIFTMKRLSTSLFQAALQPMTDRRRTRARDLWLTGVTGRVAAEAAYLEGAQRSRHLPVILGIMLPLVPMAFAVIGLSRSPGNFAAAVAAVAFFVLVGGPALAEIERFVRVRMIQLRVIYWERPLSPSRDLAIGIRSAMAAMVFSIANMAIIMPPMLIVMPAFAMRRMAVLSPTTLFIRDNWGIVMAAWLLVIAVVLRLLVPWFRRINGRRWKYIQENADRSFHTFFLRVLMEDPDG